MSWLWISLFFSGVDWVFAYRLEPRVRNYTKPLPMISMFVWTLTLNNPFRSEWVFVSLSIFFNLIGSILTLRAVGKELAAFLFYVLSLFSLFILLTLEFPPLNLSTLLFTVIVVFVMLRVFKRIHAGASAKGNVRLIIAADVYILSTGGLLLAGLLTFSNPYWSPNAALAAATGIVLLAISAILTTWLLTVGRLPHYGLIKKVPEHTGFIFLILAMIIQFG